MKIFKIILLILICFQAYASDVKNIPTKDYFSTISTLIKSTEKEIMIILDKFSASYPENNDPVLKVIQSLSLAAIAGIDVKFILNPDYRIFKTDEKSNDTGYELIKSSGAKINFLEESFQTTSQLIIFDRKTVILGGPPWLTNMRSGPLIYNTVQINNAELAESYIQEYNNIPKKDRLFEKVKTPFKGKVVSVNSLLFSIDILNNFFKLQPEVLDFYIYLLGKDSDKMGRLFKLPSSKDLCSRLFKKSKTRTQSAAFIKDSLKKLKKLKLLTWQKNKDRILTVKLKESDSKVHIPLDFFRFNYTGILNKQEKIIFIYILSLSAKENSFPLFSLNDSFFTRFTPFLNAKETLFFFNSLRKKLLIAPQGEVKNDSVLFNILPPISMEMIKKNMELLKIELGEKNLKEVRILASQFHRENDIEALRDLIYYIKELGLIETQKIIHELISLPYLHPDRTFREVKRNFISRLHHKVN